MLKRTQKLQQPTQLCEDWRAWAWKAETEYEKKKKKKTERVCGLKGLFQFIVHESWWIWFFLRDLGFLLMLIGPQQQCNLHRLIFSPYEEKNFYVVDSYSLIFYTLFKKKRN